MNGLGVAALVVLAVPSIALVVWIVREQRSARRRRRFLERHKERSVAGIRERVKREREVERVAKADTQVLPAISPDDVPTQPLPKYVPLPQRTRPHVERRPTPWPRRQYANQPDKEVMQRILYGLKRLE